MSPPALPVDARPEQRPRTLLPVLRGERDFRRTLLALFALLAGCHALWPLGTPPADGHHGGDAPGLLDGAADASGSGEDGAVDLALEGPSGDLQRADHTAFDSNVSPAGTWARSIGGTDIDRLNDVAVDSAGNIYVAGEFSNTVTVNGASISASGPTDALVASYDSNGALRWFVPIGGTSGDSARGVAVRGASVYVTGDFQETSTLTGKTTITIAGAGKRDIFIAALDTADGGAQWAKAFGAAENDYGRGVAVDSAGNLYLTGDLGSNVTFDTLKATASQLGEPFVAALAPQGTAIWVHSGDGGNGVDQGRAVATGGGVVWAVGSVWSTQTAADALAVSLDASSGVPLTTALLKGPDDDHARGVAVDGAGNSYITGEFGQTLDGPGFTLTASGQSNVFVVSLTKGGLQRWSQGFSSAGAAKSAGYDLLFEGGKVWVAGAITGAVTFGGPAVSGPGNRDIFVAALEPTSGLHHYSGAWGSAGFDAAYGVTLSAGYVVLAGEAQGQVAFPGAALLPAGSGYDGFLLRYKP